MIIIGMFDKEIWKDIKGYEGIYQVSNKGRIKSLGNNKNRKEKILKQNHVCEDYLAVYLNKYGKRKAFRVSRLVYMHFIGDIPEGMQVNHIDENKNNNDASNLNLLTPKDNCNWGTRNKRMTNSLLNRIDLSKPVLQINKIDNSVVNEYKSIMDASRKTNISKSCISSVCNNKTKEAGGYIWIFKH